MRLRLQNVAAAFVGAASFLTIVPVGWASTLQDEGLWLMVAAQGAVSEANPKLSRWRWWIDGHARLFEDSDGYGQSIVRPAVGYAITDGSVLWAGYAWIRTSPANGPDFDENRIWQQWTGSASVSRVTVSWRSRLEQRFVEGGEDVGWRVRQFFKVVHPIAFDSRLRLVGYEELFLGLNDTDWGADSGFDQNRLFVGFGWQLDDVAVLELGYLNQFLRRPERDDLMNHILSINLLFQF